MRKLIDFLLGVLCSLGLLAYSAVGQGISDHADRSAPTAIVSQYRAELSELQGQYLRDIARTEALPQSLVSSPLETYVDTLRGDLRRVVLTHLGASNEADRAVARAAMALLEKRLAAYESVYGKWDGIRSDRWSVLKAVELDGIESQLRQRMRLLMAEVVILPQGVLSQEALALGQDLRAQFDGLQMERARRRTGTAQLMTISDSATAPRAGTAWREFDWLNGPGLELEAEKVLAFEIEKAKAWDPGNRALASIDAEIKAGKYRAKIAALLRESVWKSGWPPGRGPPPGWEPPPGSGAPKPPSGPKGPYGGGMAVADVREGIAAEIKALTRGDLRSAADSAAQWKAASAWLNERVGHVETGFGGAIISLSETELNATLTELKNLKAFLVAEETSNPSPEAGLRMEIQETDARIESLCSEIRNRGPPPLSPELGPRGSSPMAIAAEAAPTGGRVQDYTTYAAEAIEQQRLFELERRVLFAPDAAQRALIQEALAIQATRVRQIRLKTASLATVVPARPEAQKLAAILAEDGLRLATLKAMVYACAVPGNHLLDPGGRCARAEGSTGLCDRVNSGAVTFSVPDVDGLEAAAVERFTSVGAWRLQRASD